MEKQDKRKIKKGEPGYHERNTGPAHEACKLFKSAEQFTEFVNDYFDECDRKGVLYDEAGMCLYLTRRVGRNVTLERLRAFYDGVKCDDDFSDAVQMAYLRIQEQIATDERYQDKAMVTRAIFLTKQSRLGGYQDKIETKNETKVDIVFGESVSASDFK